MANCEECTVVLKPKEKNICDCCKKESSASLACSIRQLSKQEIMEAIDRVMNVLDNLSDDDLFAELDKFKDGPIASALRGE